MEIKVILAILLQISLAKCDDVVKSSLTFVIDDTGSMGDDIAQVKAGVNLIFDTVMESKHSQIENFVLVTFNDPDVRLATVTRDRTTFKQALERINVHGGDDCPEYCMSGIESALENSLPGSYIYVFTDASAKDYKKYAYVKSLAQKKSSQIVFVLTGMCGGYSSPDYLVYVNLAAATSGQVFHLGKSDVRDILEYVIESIKGRRTVLGSGTFSPGYGHKINYTTDEHIPDVVISASGDEPKIDVTDPEGGKPHTEKIVDTKKVSVVKVTGTKPGVYTAEVGSKSDTTALITGRTTIDFQHGFSTFKPTSIKDTATRPQRDVTSHLSIKLNIVEGGEVKLTHVKILDLDGKSVLEKPLQVLNEGERLYTTPEPIVTPTNMFRIMVIGYSVANNATITRLSPTPIEPQNPAIEKKENRPPTVTIVGGPKVITNYSEPRKLSCRVNAYPKPDIIWQEEGSGILLPSTVAAVELPYDYISILEIESVKKNVTYVCKSTNAYGADSKSVTLEVPVYFNPLETPKDTVVRYDTAKTFLCKIDASPPANITWLKNGNELGNDDEVTISSDGSVMTIPKMEPHLQGYYECKANNSYKNETFKFKVAISGVEPPKIDKRINKVYVEKGSDPEIICRLIEGIPRPKFNWYFKSIYYDRSYKIKSGYADRISIKNIKTANAGLYRCVAYNAIGHDEHQIELVVEYPPTIKEGEKRVSGKAGESITLKCEVDAIPVPTVTWKKGDTLIVNSPTTQIYRDHSLKLQLSTEDSGTYKCEASNRLGTVSKTIDVDVYVPAHIEPPKETPVYSKVGDDIQLQCNADGVPKPDVKWVIQNKLGETTKIIGTGDLTELFIPRAQLYNEGYYTCIASNFGGSFNITYDVKVYAPPIIENNYTDKTFRPIEGDLVLMIKCNATGNPKPEITWTKDTMNIAAGTPWYDIDKDGTLFIKNIDSKATGSYVCRAHNILGNDTELFYVAADPYPIDAPPKSVVLIEEGTTRHIECNVPHDIVDSIRWYKDRRLLTHGELTIHNARISDTGLYVCRESDFFKSRSGYTRVQVGFKPKFTTVEEEDVEFSEENIAVLGCTAVALPPAKTTWQHNGNLMNITTPENVFYMTKSSYGNYTCEVSNEFGTIQRTFNMRSRDCYLSVTDDFTGNQPLMFTSPLNWPTYETADGRVIIPNGDYVSLLCPEAFTTFPSAYAMAFCDGEQNFLIKGTTYKYSELKCTSKVEPNINHSGDECLGEGSELLTVEYEALDGFLRAYDVCFDKNNKIPFYTKHTLDRHLADMEPKDANWSRNDLLPFDFEKMYSCNDQVTKISIMLGKWFHADDRCCFRKRQLVNPRDMTPGLLQTSTYNYLNVVPHWSSCGTSNWDDLEERIRKLVKSIDYPLTIWTGAHKQVHLPNGASVKMPVYISDAKERKQPAPLYLWKVIQDPVMRASLAVVQINKPDLEPSEVFDYVLCGDMCDDIPWLRGIPWHDVTKGYTYCCNIRDFEKAFGYTGVFTTGHNRVLQRVSSLSELYLI